MANNYQPSPYLVATGIALVIGTLLALFWPLVARGGDGRGYPPDEVPITFENAQTTAQVALVAPPATPHLTPQEKIAAALPAVMLRIADAESSFDPTATNASSTAKGLFQILNGTWRGTGCTGNPFNADDNIACAKKLYTAQGTNPWLASKDKWQ